MGCQAARWPGIGKFSVLLASTSAGRVQGKEAGQISAVFVEELQREEYMRPVLMPPKSKILSVLTFVLFVLPSLNHSRCFHVSLECSCC